MRKVLAEWLGVRLAVSLGTLLSVGLVDECRVACRVY
jgi:hypothetical protein